MQDRGEAITFTGSFCYRRPWKPGHRFRRHLKQNSPNCVIVPGATMTGKGQAMLRKTVILAVAVAAMSLLPLTDASARGGFGGGGFHGGGGWHGGEWHGGEWRGGGWRGGWGGRRSSARDLVWAWRALAGALAVGVRVGVTRVFVIDRFGPVGVGGLCP